MTASGSLYTGTNTEPPRSHIGGRPQQCRFRRGIRATLDSGVDHMKIGAVEKRSGRRRRFQRSPCAGWGRLRIWSLAWSPRPHLSQVCLFLWTIAFRGRFICVRQSKRSEETWCPRGRGQYWPCILNMSGSESGSSRKLAGPEDLSRPQAPSIYRAIIVQSSLIFQYAGRKKNRMSTTRRPNLR